MSGTRAPTPDPRSDMAPAVASAPPASAFAGQHMGIDGAIRSSLTKDPPPGKGAGGACFTAAHQKGAAAHFLSSSSGLGSAGGSLPSGGSPHKKLAELQRESLQRALSGDAGKQPRNQSGWTPPPAYWDVSGAPVPGYQPAVSYEGRPDDGSYGGGGGGAGGGVGGTPYRMTSPAAAAAAGAGFPRGGEGLLPANGGGGGGVPYAFARSLSASSDVSEASSTGGSGSFSGRRVWAPPPAFWDTAGTPTSSAAPAVSRASSGDLNAAASSKGCAAALLGMGGPVLPTDGQVFTARGGGRQPGASPGVSPGLSSGTSSGPSPDWLSPRVSPGLSPRQEDSASRLSSEGAAAAILGMMPTGAIARGEGGGAGGAARDRRRSFEVPGGGGGSDALRWAAAPNSALAGESSGDAGGGGTRTRAPEGPPGLAASILGMDGPWGAGGGFLPHQGGAGGGGGGHGHHWRHGESGVQPSEASERERRPQGMVAGARGAGYEGAAAAILGGLGPTPLSGIDRAPTAWQSPNTSTSTGSTPPAWLGGQVAAAGSARASLASSPRGGAGARVGASPGSWASGNNAGTAAAVLGMAGPPFEAPDGGSAEGDGTDAAIAPSPGGRAAPPGGGFRRHSFDLGSINRQAMPRSSSSGTAAALVGLSPRKEGGGGDPGGAFCDSPPWAAGSSPMGGGGGGGVGSGRGRDPGSGGSSPQHSTSTRSGVSPAHHTGMMGGSVFTPRSSYAWGAPPGGVAGMSPEREGGGWTDPWRSGGTPDGQLPAWMVSGGASRGPSSPGLSHAVTDVASLGNVRGAAAAALGMGPGAPPPWGGPLRPTRSYSLNGLPSPTAGYSPSPAGSLLHSPEGSWTLSSPEGAAGFGGGGGSGGGVAMGILAMPPGSTGSAVDAERGLEEDLANAHFHLPQSVLATFAAALQADVTIAAVLQNSHRVAETVLCEPPGLIALPVRLSRALLAASKGKVVDTTGMLLPSMLTAALGARPCRYLAIIFSSEGVPAHAEEVMSDAALALPLLLANRVRAMCRERMGRRFDAILTRMPQAVVFVDDGTGPALVNPAAADLLELPRQATAGEVDPALVARALRQLAQRSEQQEEVFRWFRLVAANPQEIMEATWELQDPRFVLRVRSYPVGGGSSAASSSSYGRVWLLDDVTVESDASLAAEAADAAKSQFLAMMSHELRTPMTGVLGMLDLLRLTPLTSEQSGYVRVMEGSAEGLMQVLNEILDFSQIEAGNFTLEEVDFSSGELLEQEKKLDLKVNLPSPDEMPVRGDPNRLRQVLTNLLSNAIKFTEHGCITIGWQRTSSIRGSRGTLPRCPPDDGKSAAAAAVAGAGAGAPATATLGGSEKEVASRVKENEGGLAGDEPTCGPGAAAAAAGAGAGAELLFREISIGREISSASGGGGGGDARGGARQPGPPSASLMRSGPSWPGLIDTLEDVPPTIAEAPEEEEKVAELEEVERGGGRGAASSSAGAGAGAGAGVGNGTDRWGQAGAGEGGATAADGAAGGGRPHQVPAASSPMHAPRDVAASDELTELERRDSLAEASSALTMSTSPSASECMEDTCPRGGKSGKSGGGGGAQSPQRAAVVIKGNGQLALDAVQAEPYDMILMDLQMPVMDGLTATRAIRALEGPVAKIPIYALTADVLTKAASNLEDLGLDGYITKPINWDALSVVIAQVNQSKLAGGGAAKELQGGGVDGKGVEGDS
eukprot:jgi/Mesen1/4533/ME000231S03791